MADFELSLISQTSLSDTSTILFSVPKGKTCIITEMIFCNTHEEDVMIYANFVKLNEGLSVKNTILKDLIIKPNETYRMTFNTFLPQYSTIRLYASVNEKVSCNISGVVM